MKYGQELAQALRIRSLLTEAWVEIACGHPFPSSPSCRPLRGAWVEMPAMLHMRLHMRSASVSPPLRGVD